MLSKIIHTGLFATTTLRLASAQTVCNNSPELCSRAYNEVTFLGTHDAPFLRDESTGFSTSGNQFYNTTVQLSAGVRMLQTQIQNPENSNELHNCHTSCNLLDAGTLSEWLVEIKTWMDANPHEVVTLLIVNGPGASAAQIAEAYASSGMDQYAYTPAYAAATADWPTLSDIISSGRRAMNFISTLDDNAAAPYLLNQWTYMVENDYRNTSPTDYTCAVDRPSWLSGQTTAAVSQGYLMMQNHFLYDDQLFGIQTPNETYASITNAPSGGVGNLGSAAAACQAQYGKAPNFLLVDFWNVGPSIETADNLNGLSNVEGREMVPTTIPSRGAAGTSSPEISTFCLGLSAALLARLVL